MSKITPATPSGEYPVESVDPVNEIRDWTIRYKSNDRQDLNTYLHFGDDNLLLTTNVVRDNKAFTKSPYSSVYKLYEPLPDDINEKDMTYIVKEILPELTETVELFPYEQEDEDVLVLIQKENLPENSPLTDRSVELQSFSV